MQRFGSRPSTAPTAPARLALTPEAAFAPAALHDAWRRVRANGGGPGGDGDTIDSFARQLDRRLAALAADLASGRYRPGPLRRVAIAKPAGGKRELAIPCLRDRVAQTALLNALTPQLDHRMSETSFAYRPGRSVAQALAAARTQVAQGRRIVVDADIAGFFDNVPHAPLLAELGIWLDDPRLLALIGLWLRGFNPTARGLAQGAPLSPLLANLWLHPLDRLLAAAGHAAIRYADDFVVLCRHRAEADRALALVHAICAERGLLLHAAKTRIAEAAEVRFLGEDLWPAALPPRPGGMRLPARLPAPAAHPARR
jgi:group II intron reverse transcriptase/maturase